MLPILLIYRHLREVLAGLWGQRARKLDRPGGPLAALLALGNRLRGGYAEAWRYLARLAGLPMLFLAALRLATDALRRVARPPSLPLTLGLSLGPYRISVKLERRAAPRARLPSQVPVEPCAARALAALTAATSRPQSPERGREGTSTHETRAAGGFSTPVRALRALGEYSRLDGGGGDGGGRARRGGRKAGQGSSAELGAASSRSVSAAAILGGSKGTSGGEPRAVGIRALRPHRGGAEAGAEATDVPLRLPSEL